MNLAFDLEKEIAFSSQHEPANTYGLNAQEKTIHERALEKARVLKKAHAELLAAVIEVDISRLYVKFQLNSTFSYCTKILGLSEDVTCTLTRLARVSSVVPELKMAIDEGGLNISNARHIAAILTPENKSEWLEKAKILPQKKLQYEVAKSFPQQAVQERAKFIAADRIKLEMGLNAKMMEDFRRAQDLVSQKLKGAASLEVTMEELLQFFLERNDPLVKAKRALNKPSPVKAKVSVAIRGAEQKFDSRRKHIPSCITCGEPKRFT